MQHYLNFWRNYVNFSGRTTRTGYWMAFLFNVIFAFLLGILVAIVPVLSFLVGIYSLAGIIPGIAICIRRLRDAGLHWAWYFIAFVPLVGGIVLLIMLCQPTARPAAPPRNDPVVVVVPPAIPAGEKTIGPGAIMVQDNGISIFCKNTSLAGQCWRSNHGESIMIGRNPSTCKICFPENTIGVSREHCKIYSSNGRWYVQDLSSTYGTYAGGKRLDPNEGFLLRSGENIFIGSQQVWLTIQ